MAKKKEKPTKVDGLGPEDKKKLRTAIRQVWSWSYPRRLCIKRALNEQGFAVCELCKQTVPKVYPDHIKAVGEFSEGFVERMFCPSTELQALCSKCHGKKTRADKKAMKGKR